MPIRYGYQQDTKGLPMISNMVAVANGKGGVYKTSVVANLAGIAALSGWKVLAIDMDPQGHVALDLGVEDQSDFGAGLRHALETGEPPEPIRDVRQGLDLIPAGEELTAAVGSLQNRLAAGQITEAVAALETAITPLASNYNLILVDSPPGEKVLQQTILTASHFAIIPTKPDLGSIRGLDRLCRNYLDAQRYNPSLQLMGVILTGVGRGSTRIERTAREELNRLLDDLVPTYNTTIHHLEQGALARNSGLLLHEYETKAETSKAGEYSQSAGGLASDYQQLADEFLADFAERSQREASA